MTADPERRAEQPLPSAPDPDDSIRRRVLFAAITAVAATLPLGFMLSGAESVQWVGNAHYHVRPSVWSALLPRAAFGAFSLPYAVLAVMAVMRARATGAASRVIGWAGVITYAALLLAPAGYGVMFLLWIVGGVFAGFASGPTQALIGLAAPVLYIVLFWLQRRLIRDGGALDRATRPSAPASTTGTTWMALLAALYVSAWTISLFIPEAMGRANLLAAHRVRDAAAAAERARIPVGAPLLLSWEADALPGRAARDRYAPVRATVGRDGSIYVAFADGIAALDANGRLRWRADSIRPGVSAVVPGSDGLVFVGGANGVLYALRATDGAIAWRAPIVTAGASAVGVHDPTLGADGSIYAGAWSRGADASATVQHLASDGHELWAPGLAGGLSAPLLIGPGDTSYAVGDYDGWDTVYAVSPKGSVVWRTPFFSTIEPSARQSVVLLRDGTLAVAARDHLFFFSRAGARLAQQAPERAVVAVGDSAILLVRGDRVALATRASAADSGQARWLERWRYGAARVAEEEHLPSGAVVLDGGRAVISTSWRVVVLRLADGHPLAEYVQPMSEGGDRAGHPGRAHLSVPAVGPDGTIYVASSDHHVYALRDTVHDEGLPAHD